MFLYFLLHFTQGGSIFINSLSQFSARVYLFFELLLPQKGVTYDNVIVIALLLGKGLIPRLSVRNRGSGPWIPTLLANKGVLE